MPLPEPWNFYSHAPRGARQNAQAQKYRQIYFYSHAPRGARLKLLLQIRYAGISTHTPLAGRDDRGNEDTTIAENFYSHAPRGARRYRH